MNARHFMISIGLAPSTATASRKKLNPDHPGKAWFVSFRLYAPFEPRIDPSRPLPDNEEKPNNQSR